MVVPRKPLAGAGQAGLYLVNDERHAALVADLADATHVVAVGDVDAAFALNDFEQHRAAARVQRRLERVRVVVGHVAEAFGQRLERLVLLGLAGGVQGCQSAPME